MAGAHLRPEAPTSVADTVPDVRARGEGAGANGEACDLSSAERARHAAAWVSARHRRVDADTPGLTGPNGAPRGDRVGNAAVGLVAKRATDIAGVGDDAHPDARPRRTGTVNGLEIRAPDVDREQHEQHQNRRDDHELDHGLAALRRPPCRFRSTADHWTRPTVPMVCEPAPGSPVFLNV